jgi:DnaJ-class molecular chaperone
VRLGDEHHNRLYEILGVEVDASQVEIESAYERLHLLSEGEVKEAYKVLADPETRELYDRFGDDYLKHIHA